MFTQRHRKDKVDSPLRAGVKIFLPVAAVMLLLASMARTNPSSAAGRPPTSTPNVTATPTQPSGPGCTSTADCLSKMTLDEKIGQMTQVNKNALSPASDITTYYLGSLLSGGNAAHVTDICSRVTQCIVILFSGRPLIINTQLNQSDAFVAAWLPGTEGAGITDVLFGDFGFTGTLPVTWPNAVTQEPINAGDGQTGLFPFGFGLTPY